jgi:hypothetical protein
MIEAEVGADSWHSYPSVYALGHRALAELFSDPVVIEEKVDGSQFSFGSFGGVLRVRSKGQEIFLDGPIEGMFQRAVETVVELAPLLHDGWTYRAEYLQKPSHNALAYSRIPAKHLIVFDINTGHERYMSYEDKAVESARLGLEAVPLIGAGVFTSPGEIAGLLTRESILGGQLIEGVVVKNYARFGGEKKALMGKYVSERFKEVHAAKWGEANPDQRDVVQQIIGRYKTTARWNKAIQHLRESGRLLDGPQDIGPLMAEVSADVEKECADEIRDILYAHFWPQVRRAVAAGLPEWYKLRLLDRQFDARP